MTAFRSIPTKLDRSILLQEVSTSIATRPIRENLTASRVLRPQWSKAELPYIEVAPTSIAKDPIRVDDFLLWPNPEYVRGDLEAMLLPVDQMRRIPIDIRPLPIERRPVPIDSDETPPTVPPRPLPVMIRQAFFALAVPRLIDVALTVESAVQPDRSIRITRGTAVLTVGVYAQEDVQTIAKYQQTWIDAIAKAGYDQYPWKFLPLNLRNLQATIDLPAAHLATPPQVSTNPNAGTATLILELSEAGVLVWKSALEQRSGHSIPGIVRLSASYFGKAQSRVDVQQQTMEAPLGILLRDRGAEVIRLINPQQTVEGKLVVIGNDLIQSVSVSLMPNQGQAPATQVFGKEGGQVGLAITTQQVDQVEINWSAQVSFTPSNWSVIPISGKFSNQAGWTDMIKPDSWIANYNLMAVFVDRAGKPAPTDRDGRVLLSDQNGVLTPMAYQINGVLTFTAPYIPNTNTLVAPFQPRNQNPVIMALPRFPGQPFGKLVLTLFVTLETPQGQLASTQTRLLSEAELGVVAIVHPDAQVEIKTSLDALPESSTESDMLGILQAL